MPINAFPGYEFKEIPGEKGPQNMYRGTNLGFGGYIVGNPGIYRNVAMLDVRSLHPSSIIAMNCFGKYTQHFKDLLDARVAIKERDFETARTMLNGRLAPYLDDESTAKDLAQALKIAVNSVYGLTAANFDNPFRDIRNKNNIVALRGALFMRTLQDEVEQRGYTVVGIRTDSIKIADADQDIVDFCMDFANKYSYVFEYECHYDRICLVNKSAYIARYSDNQVNGKKAGQWTATAKQFQVPYVFKTLFSKEPIIFDDLCEVKEVRTGALYLDMNENLPIMDGPEKELAWRNKVIGGNSDYIGYKDPAFKNVSDDELRNMISKAHNYVFVGRVGQFCPIKPGCGGGELVVKRNDKYSSAAGAKGYRWLESDTVRNLHNEANVDRSYYTKLVDEAVEDISQYGDFEAFVAD